MNAQQQGDEYVDHIDELIASGEFVSRRAKRPIARRLSRPRIMA